MTSMNRRANGEAVAILILVLLGLALLFIAMWGLPRYGVYRQGLAGEAELRRAEQNRKIQVQEAQARKDSATLLAQAEVERAKGVAEANKIIGDSLQGNEAYLHYLWLHALETTSSQGDKVIYVPTEANLPIMEAGKR